MVFGQFSYLDSFSQFVYSPSIENKTHNRTPTLLIRAGPILACFLTLTVCIRTSFLNFEFFIIYTVYTYIRTNIYKFKLTFVRAGPYKQYRSMRGCFYNS